MKEIKKRLIVCTISLLVVGCLSPRQGAGALYIAEKGFIKCVDVDSVTFVSSRRTVYIIDGAEHIAQEAMDFYLGQPCN